MPLSLAIQLLLFTNIHPQDNGTLLAVALVKNKIGIGQAEALASMLKEHPTLKSLSTDQFDPSAQITPDNLPNMVLGVQSSWDPPSELAATMHLRKLLSVESNPPIQQVIDAEVVPRFVEFLGRDDDQAIQVRDPHSLHPVRCIISTTPFWYT
jgi:hypothetical protein